MTCHEFGHFLSGKKRGAGNPEWLDDYWGAIVCAPQVFVALIDRHHINVADEAELLKVTPRTQRYVDQCDAVFGTARGSSANPTLRYVCYRIARAAEDVIV